MDTVKIRKVCFLKILNAKDPNIANKYAEEIQAIETEDVLEKLEQKITVEIEEKLKKKIIKKIENILQVLRCTAPEIVAKYQKEIKHATTHESLENTIKQIYREIEERNKINKG